MVRTLSKGAAAADPRSAIGVIALLLALATTNCDRRGPASGVTETPAARVPAAVDTQPANRAPDHDLSADESMGGHTLARHVGRTDAELVERLRREPQISTASTYTDRATAERVAGAALASAGRSFAAWRERTGRRPNFVLHYAAGDTIGRSVSRGRPGTTPCRNALIVLHWDDRHDRFYVLTSYPEPAR